MAMMCRVLVSITLRAELLGFGAAEFYPTADADVVQDLADERVNMFDLTG